MQIDFTHKKFKLENSMFYTIPQKTKISLN